LLPTGFMERVSAEDARAAVAHELAHVRRGDFGKNLICRVLALPVSYHPCAWAMQARLAESREMACDALAAEQVGGPGRYARSLLRLAAALPDALPGSIQGSQQTAGLAVGMLEGNRLERRVVQMMQTRKELNGMAKAAVMAGLLLMTAGAGATVGGMHLRVQGDVEGAHPPSGKILTVPGRVMAGNSLPKVNPTYPASAKHDKVQGTVILAMRIDKEGVPTDVRVQKGVRADLDESALTAVRKWRYKPYLLNGAPTEVETTVRVTYSLEK
jgi:TonB family protein